MNRNTAVGLSDLPASFEIEKYDACANFTAVDWYLNLVPRAIRLTFSASNVNTELGRYQAGAIHSLDYPIVRRRMVTPEDGYSGTLERSSVRDQTAYELVSGHSALDDDTGKYRNAHEFLERNGRATPLDADWEQARDFTAFEIAYDTLNVPAWKMLKDLNFPQSREAMARVDLSATNEKILADFKAWLLSTRVASQAPVRKNQFTPSIFRRWHVERILAYMDLRYWAQTHGLTITSAVIGNALFPNERNTSSYLPGRIERTVDKSASEACRSVDALLAQALDEQDPAPTKTGKKAKSIREK